MGLRMKSNFHKDIIFSSPIRGSRMGDCEACPTLDLLGKSPDAHLPRAQVPGSAGEGKRVGVTGSTNLALDTKTTPVDE
jgi:hypothetical protein